jgi:hypothetical protein
MIVVVFELTLHVPVLLEANIVFHQSNHRCLQVPVPVEANIMCFTNQIIVASIEVILRFFNTPLPPIMLRSNSVYLSFHNTAKTFQDV